MKNILFSLLSLCAFALFSNQATAQTAVDEQALRNLITSAMQDYYKADADKLVSYYSDNATSVAFNGMVLQGKETIRQMTAEMLKADPPSPENFKYEIAGVRFIHPDVASVMLNLEGKSKMGDQMVEWKGVNSMILVKKSGKWLVEVETATPIMPMEGY
jgi:uncharacterized protein (TIGR02246 family)